MRHGSLCRAVEHSAQDRWLLGFRNPMRAGERADDAVPVRCHCDALEELQGTARDALETRSRRAGWMRASHVRAPTQASPMPCSTGNRFFGGMACPIKCELHQVTTRAQNLILGICRSEKIPLPHDPAP